VEYLHLILIGDTEIDGQERGEGGEWQEKRVANRMFLTDNRYMRKWYVVTTKPRNEDRAANNLQHGSIEVLAPKLRLRKFREGQFVSVIEPMFPGYIFVKFHPVDEFRLVKYTRGIKSIVSFGGCIVPIQDELIEFIRSKLEAGIVTVEQRKFQEGERIFIKDGPFKNLSGIFEKELDGKERVTILLDGINYCARMEIDRDFLVSA
jgi:transcription elongation factor/antiterminator RfaH